MTAGERLAAAIHDALPDDMELSEREQEMLRLAAGQADDLERLEKAMDDSDLLTTGSKGQVVLSPLVQETRQARLAIYRLLGGLSLVDLAEELEGDGKRQTAASQRASRAAKAKHGRREHAAKLRSV
jgi:hypothetical protein